MDKKTYNIFKILIIIFVAAMMGLWAPIGNLVLAFVFLLIGFILLYVIRKKVNEVTEDERNYLITANASKMAMLMFLIIITVGGISLLALKKVFPEYTQAGFTLCNASALLILLYIGFYGYYSRKHG